MSQWEVFLQQIASTTKDINEPFFRGHSDSNWPLVPSLGRHKFYSAFENNIYYDFLTFGASLLPPSVDSWDTLFIMRHHALPTRLLDWTQSFSTALYFALRAKEGDAAIWVLNPFLLNKRTIRNEAILHPQTDFRYGYYEYFVDDRRKKFPGEALAILPNKTTARVLAQRGVFTIQKHSSAPLNDICKDALKKVILPRAAMSGAREFLKLAGTNEFTLFPDLDGLSRWLRDSHDVNSAKPRKPRLKKKRAR